MTSFDSPLPFFGVIQITGEDAASFLHRQLSNHIEDLQANQACFATYNSAKGRVIANFLVVRYHDAFLIIASADLCDVLIRRLNLFVLRSKVKLTRSENQLVYGGTYADTHGVHALKFDVIDSENGLILPLSHNNSLTIKSISPNNRPSDADESTWFAREIHAGRPWISQATSELCVAQMLNQHQLGAIHFKKGCYPGQEIIARAQYRGQVKRGLVCTSSQHACSIGAGIIADGEEAGWVINQAEENGQWIQLCVIKHAAAGQSLYSNNTALTVTHIHFEDNA